MSTSLNRVMEEGGAYSGEESEEQTHTLDDTERGTGGRAAGYGLRGY